MALNEKAMKVYLRRTRPSLTKRDSFGEEFLQDALGDQSLMVSKKLFRDPTNPINQLMKKHDRVYHEHKLNTLPFVDAGPRLLAATHYMPYRNIVSAAINDLETAKATHMPNYHAYVDMDVTFRKAQDEIKYHGKIKPPGYVPPSADEYPTATEFAQALTCQLTFEALPDTPHWLLDEDKADCERREKALEIAAANHVVTLMLKPVKHLADKLVLPIGEKGSIFRDSAIENIQEAIDQARMLVIESTPELEAVFASLKQTVETYSTKVEWLRESPINREEAAKKLREIEAQMGAIMGQ